MDVRTGFARVLRGRMAELGVTCQQVADTAGVSLATVHRWRAAKTEPSMTQAQAVASLLGMTVPDLCATDTTSPEAA